MTQAELLAAWERVPRGCRYTEREGVGFFSLPVFEAFLNIRHGFTARTGGVSTGCLASLNLSFPREEASPENVRENYRIFCRAAGIDESGMVMDSFQHGTSVRRVFADDAGRGYTLPPLPPCDALITDDPAVALITGHADCMAIYFYDPVRCCIGLAHAGWRGALARLGACVVAAMREEFGSAPADLYAGIGPSICADCFQVDCDVGDAFRTAFTDMPCVRHDAVRGKDTVDLWMAAFCQLVEAGVPAGHISLMDVCTFEDGRLYSHRRDRGKTGGMAAFLTLGQRFL